MSHDLKTTNSVFIAASLDGFIADSDGKIDWLHATPNPENDDMGYNAFIARMDAIVMGRVTFETVRGFDMEWPYSLPVFVLSNTMSSVPEDLQDKVALVSGSLSQVLDTIHGSGYRHLYIDGGSTIQSFLREDLIDEMIVTTIPVLLGGGSALFGTLDGPLAFHHVKATRYLDAIVQNHYKRKRTGNA